jgi:hypothetical protein
MFCFNKKLNSKLDLILDEITFLKLEVNKMAVSQAQFDTQLAALVAAVNQLLTDFANKNSVDLTAEAASVASMLSGIQAADPATIPPASSGTSATPSAS